MIKSCFNNTRDADGWINGRCKKPVHRGYSVLMGTDRGLIMMCNDHLDQWYKDNQARPWADHEPIEFLIND